MILRRPALLALPLVPLAACTLSTGAPAPADPCLASPRYFVSTFYSGYIERNQCSSPSCHDFATGSGYTRFRVAGPPPAASASRDSWPEAWNLNYLNAIQLLRCDAPAASRLLTVPLGQADPHPVGDVIEEPELATRLFTEWVAAP